MNIGQALLSLAFWCIVAAILLKIATTCVQIIVEALKCARAPEESLREFFTSHNFEDPNKRVGR